MPPIKVVHLIDGLTMGGAEMMLYKVVSRMDRTQFESVVIAFMEEGPVRKMIEEAGIPVLSLGMAQGKPSAKAFFTLVNLLRRERPAVLQTWSKTADLIGLLAGRRAKEKRAVLAPHGDGGGVVRPPLSLAAPHCRKLADGNRGVLRDRLPPKRVANAPQRI
ncbi:MAG: glycosyltransferase [Armatimonadetes bacterium]|nr:glycosyltransferase [Armatimonadota bacterium]